MRWCVLFAVLLAAGGCGRAAEYRPVSGTVTMDGDPLPDVIVVFQPVATGGGGDAGGVGSFGRTDAQGRFTLQAMTPDPREGALVGRHRVSIGSPDEVPDDQESDAINPSAAPRPQRNMIPARYNVNSTLEYDVPSEGLKDVVIPLVSQE